jgi:hypothetical protein
MKFQKEIEKNRFAIVRKVLTRNQLKKVIGMDLEEAIKYFCSIPKIRHYFDLLFDDCDLCLDKGLVFQKYKVAENLYIWPNYYLRGLLFVYPCQKVYINGEIFSFNIGDLLFIDSGSLMDFGKFFDEDDYLLELPLKPSKSFALGCEIKIYE